MGLLPAPEGLSVSASVGGRAAVTGPGIVPVLALLLATLSGLALPPMASGQGISADTTVRTRLVGRTETATVDLTIHGGAVAADSTPWRNRLPPLSAGTGTAATLWTDLQIRLGDLVMEPGEYRLWMTGPHSLAVARNRPYHIDQLDPADVIGSVELADSTLLPPVFGWSFGIRTQRFGADTVSVSENTSRRGISVINIGLSPATRSWLVLRYRNRELKTSISAR